MSFETSFTGQCRNHIPAGVEIFIPSRYQVQICKAGVFRGVVFPPSPQNTITTPPKTIAYEAICH